MAQLAYAASMIMDSLLDVSSRGGLDALNAFTDMSEGARPGQSLTMVEPGTLTVQTAGGNAIAAEALNMTTHQLVVDLPAMVSVYVERIEDIVGLNGGMRDKVAADAWNQLREHVAGDIINRTRDALVGPTLDVGLIANSGAATLTDAHVNQAEALLRRRPGVGKTAQLSWVGSDGFEAAVKGLINYQPVTEQVGVGQISALNKMPVFTTSHLPSAAGDESVPTTASVIASAVGTQTIASGHGIIRGGLWTTTGLTANAATPVAVSATTATSASLAIASADANPQADGIGAMVSASSLGLLAHKARVAFAFAGNAFDVYIIKSPTGAGWIVQVCTTYGVKVLPGAMLAIHAPALPLS